MSSPPVPKRLASMIFTFVRARTLRTEWEKEDEKLEQQIRGMSPGSTLSLADIGRWLTFYSLWLACLQVVVEGYTKSFKAPESLLYDPQIERILEEATRVKHLRKYRNTILHPELYDHPDTSVVHREYREFANWAAALTDEFERLFKERLDTVQFQPDGDGSVRC